MTKSGHRITIVDTPGKETVSVATPQGNRLLLTEHHEGTGRPAIVLETSGDLLLAAPQGRIHMQSMLHSREVGTAEPEAHLVEAAYHPSAEKQALAPAAPAAPAADKPKWVKYKGSTTKCAPANWMTPEQQKTATAKQKEAVPGGPAYTTNGAPLSDYKGWSDLGISDSRACAIKGIAANEGNDFSAVQSYDSQALSAGAMQKTIRPDGTGELAQQMSDFRNANPVKYQSLFADKGWTVENQASDSKTGKVVNTANPVAYFQDPNNPTAPRLTGIPLQNYIRDCDGSNFEKTMRPWRNAGQDPDFQSQQISDYNVRVEQTMRTKVSSPASLVCTESATTFLLAEMLLI